LYGLVVCHFVDAEAKLGDLDAVVELHRRRDEGDRNRQPVALALAVSSLLSDRSVCFVEMRSPTYGDLGLEREGCRRHGVREGVMGVRMMKEESVMSASLAPPFCPAKLALTYDESRAICRFSSALSLCRLLQTAGLNGSISYMCIRGAGLARLAALFRIVHQDGALHLLPHLAPECFVVDQRSGDT
jgi:hypothetical protein